MTEEKVPEKAARLAEDLESADMKYHSTIDFDEVDAAAERINRDIDELKTMGFAPVNREVGGVPTFKVDLVRVGAAESGRTGPYVRRRPRYSQNRRQSLPIAAAPIFDDVRPIGGDE
jgi:hypothetical protein